MQHLDLQASSLTLNGGTFAKQIGVGEPRTTPAPQAVDEPALPEPKATEQNSEQEMQRDFSLGTPTELPMAVASSWGTRPPSTSEALDGGSPVGPTRTKLVSTAAVTSTTTSWQSSAANQPGSVLGADKKGPEASATQAPPTQAPTTQASPTQAPSTQTFSTQNPPTKAPPSQAPSTQVPVMSTIAPTAPEDSVGLITGQGDPAEASLEPEELGPPSAHTDAFMGPQASEVPITSEGDPSREPVASGSWPPKAEEPIHVTGDPQRLGILMTPVPDSQVATRRQAVGLLAFLGLLFCVGVAMFAYQSLQGCPRKVAGDMVEGLRYVPRSCGSNSYVLVPV
ncbi:fractalkine [Erinaceus europaeus]|uniref:Fractalkine n=1 Tax=Erinaceus europaeus TaxID=9365 RepID=A0ABM3WY33_ERIEU|nr:fractalkine [Erinaceus europaeus]